MNYIVNNQNKFLPQVGTELKWSNQLRRFFFRDQNGYGEISKEILNDNKLYSFLIEKKEVNYVDGQYLDLLKNIILNGTKKTSRTGVDVYSCFGAFLTFNMEDKFPLLTTKKMAWSQIVSELIWFLRGETNIQWLVKNKNYIWIGDAYKKYTNEGGDLTQFEFIDAIRDDDEFAKKYGELGPIYGNRWRNWNGKDQVSKLIQTLRTNPDDRRMIVSAWDVDELDNMVLPPCHYCFQVYTEPMTETEKEESGCDRKISLMWHQRSVDAPLGLPFNIASYALLLVILGKIVNMKPHMLKCSLGDVHVYENQLPGCHIQLSRSSFDLPELKIANNVNFNEGINEFLDSCLISDLKLKNYQSHPSINFPLNN